MGRYDDIADISISSFYAYIMKKDRTLLCMDTDKLAMGENLSMAEVILW